MKYNTVIFDLDGTLLNTLDDLCDSVNFVLEHFGFEKITKEQTKGYVGNGIRKLIERAVPNGDKNPLFEPTFALFKEYYPTHSGIKTAPYEGICALLEKLKNEGVKLGVVSNKNHNAVLSLCEKYFKDTFSIVVGEREGVMRKPAPDSVLYALEKLGSNIEDTVYIGDSQVDVMTAKNCNMDLIAVTWGFRDEKDLTDAGAKVFARTPMEIYKIIE